MFHQNQAKEETIDVVIDEVIYRSAQNDFAVVKATRLHPSPYESTFVATGQFGEVSVGENLRIHGKFKQHHQHGERFEISLAIPITPDTRQGIARYLGSGLVSGIGPALAERIVAKFGEDTLHVIAHEKARLSEIRGLGKNRANALAATVHTRRVEMESMSFLSSIGLSPSQAKRIIRQYGESSSKIIREDPYRIAEEVRGIGFQTVDQIAIKLGFTEDDPRRAAGVLLHVVARTVDEGHVYAERADVEREAENMHVRAHRVDEAFDALQKNKLLQVEDTAVYVPLLYDAECRLAQKLALLTLSKISLPKNAKTALAKILDEKLTLQQRQAVELSLHHRLLIIMGGPGTGKTTIMRSVAQLHLMLEHRVVLCAPTGRAAKRMSETSGLEARTLHRQLEWIPGLNRFRRNENEPIEADIVIVDEASMIDIRLADSLFQAINPSTTLILIGDTDQLSPISPGNVLRELIASEVIPVVRLDQIFRQAEQSAIVRGAHAVLHGQRPESSVPFVQSDGDLFFVHAQAHEEINERLLRIIDRIRLSYGFDPKQDIQVLSPMRKGPTGTDALNQLLQQSLNQTDKKSLSIPFLIGDKVMQIRNDYDKEVYNGDIGLVHNILGGSVFIHFDGREIEYSLDQLDSLSLAYASTVHKVQGSEFPCVIVIMHRAHFVLLERSLLYTAITRARKLVVLLGDPRAFDRAIQNQASTFSRSRLMKRIQDAIKKTPASSHHEKKA